MTLNRDDPTFKCSGSFTRDDPSTGLKIMDLKGNGPAVSFYCFLTLLLMFLLLTSVGCKENVPALSFYGTLG